MFSRRFLPAALLAGWLSLTGGGPGVADGPPQGKDRAKASSDRSGKDAEADPRRLAEEARRLGLKEIPRVHLYRANSSADQKKYKKAIAHFTKVIEEIGLENSCRS